MAGCVLALYDCRSKQEYIYRTNRMPEISGGSALLAELFGGFFEGLDNYKIKTDWRSNLSVSGDFIGDFEKSSLDGELLYEGGGNLFVIYRSREVYREINKTLSRYVIDKTYSVSIIASCVDVTGDFNEDRSRLYAENTTRKNQGTFLVPNNVLPFTKIDRLTYMPIVKQTDNHQYTMESLRKRNRGMERGKDNTILDNMVKKDNKSFLAVIYIDGNGMGQKLKDETEKITYYADGISRLRQFSRKTNLAFVENPIKQIEEYLTEKNAADPENRNKYLYRKVISGGDEITIVCNARLVPDILDVYFKALSASEGSNSACAGAVIFHSHAPFSEVYKIAEECCESGKTVAHLPGNQNNSYIDFHFCHSGITNNLETLRGEQGILTQPYLVGDDWEQLKALAAKIKPIGRSNIKDLGMAASNCMISDNTVIGDSSYREKLAMVRSRYPKIDIPSSPKQEDYIKTMRMISDISSVYDIWFAGGED